MGIITNYRNVRYYLNPDSSVPLAVGETSFNNIYHIFVPCDGFIYRLMKLKGANDVFFDYGTLTNNILQSSKLSNAASFNVGLVTNLHWYRRLDIDTPSVLESKLSNSPVSFEFTKEKFFSLNSLEVVINNWDHDLVNKRKIFKYIAAYVGES